LWWLIRNYVSDSNSTLLKPNLSSKIFFKRKTPCSRGNFCILTCPEPLALHSNTHAELRAGPTGFGPGGPVRGPGEGISALGPRPGSPAPALEVTLDRHQCLPPRALERTLALAGSCLKFNSPLLHLSPSNKPTSAKQQEMKVIRNPQSGQMFSRIASLVKRAPHAGPMPPLGLLVPYLTRAKQATPVTPGIPLAQGPAGPPPLSML
jgi:hypothetical protein